MPGERPASGAGGSSVAEPSPPGFLVRHFRAVGFSRDAVGHQLAGAARPVRLRPAGDG
ncbi:hypothetical protein [Streptomyces caatingaensis]|uniref:hypothetical protein n=1 Tax=Streptomyces caatingaensis TaxID=1678637 RepID=UPI0012FE9E35|nr:hypothetical protein [Streptomyces caatingaensis]